MEGKPTYASSSNLTSTILSLGAKVDIITNEKSQIRKVRYVDIRTNQMVLRVDENDECKEIDEVTRMHVYNNQYQDKTYDAIIISDYCKGFLTELDIELLCKSNKNVFVDTKKQLGSWIQNATFIKINSAEYKKNYEYFKTNDFVDKLIVTLGGEGCLYNGKKYPVKEVPVKDVSGAGDTFLAGLVCGYLDSDNIYTAIDFAQKCTTIVVQKHGVSTV